MVPIIREWIVANNPLIYFVYGLAFFVLGISIALQSRQYSRLRLARSLSWLAGFGILHALNEWADVFIPIQAEFLSEPIVMILHSIHYIVLALSFACLLQFGIELFRPLSIPLRWIRFLPMGMFFAWLIIPFAIGSRYVQDFDKWGGLVTSIARYGLCFPGAILSGIGLLRQARDQLEPMRIPHIDRTLRIAAGALFAYAIFSGLIVNPSFYFPASIINSDTFTSTFIFPPPVFRSIIGTVLAIAIIRTMEVFNIETNRLIWRMEEGQVIANERERIARDLHDGALQQVYAAGLLAQSLRKKTNSKLHEEVDRLISIVNEAIDQLRAFLPLLKPEPVSIDLFSAIMPVIEKARTSSGYCDSLGKVALAFSATGSNQSPGGVYQRSAFKCHPPFQNGQD